MFRKTAATRLPWWKETKTHVSMLVVSRRGARVEAGPCAAGGVAEGSGTGLAPAATPRLGCSGTVAPFYPRTQSVGMVQCFVMAVLGFGVIFTHNVLYL